MAVSKEIEGGAGAGGGQLYGGGSVVGEGGMAGTGKGAREAELVEGVDGELRAKR